MASKTTVISPATDEHWMRIALDEAESAVAHGDIPVGCVVIGSDGVELARGRNLREFEGDPTAHAEVVTIRRAAQTRGHWRLDGCTLYVTLEPCVMCIGAIVNARISRLVYGAVDHKAGAVNSQYSIGHDGKLNHRVMLEEGVLYKESLEKIQGFFAKLRAQGKK
jgi:tRNA(adenine34) deaminase